MTGTWQRTRLTRRSRQRISGKTWESLPSFADPRATAVGGRNDRFVIGDVRFGFSYMSTEDVEGHLDKVMNGVWGGFLDSDAPESFLGALSECEPLWDPAGTVDGWRKRTRDYPAAFRLKAIQELIFELRADLQELRRASELKDVTFFHIALSDYAARLFRLMFTVHGIWYRGPKRALRTLESTPAVPQDWPERIASMLAEEQRPSALSPVVLRCHELLVDVAEFAVGQGVEERRAVRRGLSYWPDVDPLDVDATFPAPGSTDQVEG